MFLFIAFLIFTCAIGGAAYYVWSVPQQEQQQILAARLRDLRMSGAARARSTSDLVKRESRGRFAPVVDILAWKGISERLQAYINQADLKYRAADVFALCVVIAVSVYLLLSLVGMSLLLLKLGMSLGLGAIPLIYISKIRSRRLGKFEEVLPDAIDLFNRSMKAGHNIHSGLETIATETVDPVKMEFKKVVEELGLGAPTEDVLHSLGKRVPLIDLKFFITGLILQRQTGANMVQVLENLAVLVRERLHLAAKMKAATAQQRFSAALLCCLPLVVAIGFWFMKPEYIRLLYTDPTGQMFLTYAIISETIGILIIRKIANPKF